MNGNRKENNDDYAKKGHKNTAIFSYLCDEQNVFVPFSDFGFFLMRQAFQIVLMTFFSISSSTWKMCKFFNARIELGVAAVGNSYIYFRHNATHSGSTS